MPTPSDLQRLSRAAVAELAHAHAEAAPCPTCRPYASPGWESFPASQDGAALHAQGALWLPGDDEPTLEEHRPVGVDAWSAEAPISLTHHPYNRCEVWTCKACGFPFLRYTEYGGYYIDQRIRELRAALVMNA